MDYRINLSLFLIFFISGSCSINNNLKYFETIPSSSLNHHVVKRGAKLSTHPFNTIKELQFKTLGKEFRLILHPHTSVLHSNFKAYSVDADGKETTVHVDRDNFYTGRVFGEKTSDVKLHMEDGMITGIIHTPDETYHIEPSWRHLPHSDDKTMITYRASDIRFSWAGEKSNDDGKPRVCGYVKEGKELEEADDEEEAPDKIELKHEQSEKDKYLYQIQDTEDGDTHIPESSYTTHSNISNRVKRQSDYEYTPTKTRCPLLLVADYRFFQEMGASNTKTTISYLISLIDRVHKIYNDTVWQDRQDMDGFKGMGFVIKKILVHSEPTRVRGGEAHYNMVREKWDVRNLLEVFSREYSHKDFCLAHLFTDLKFEGGILGLAYVGSPRRNSVGGICTPEYFKNGYTLYLNSGLSSSRNHYGQRVITREADLVTAHEFGHNWGSEHDPDVAECSPAASQGGSYLMYTYSVSGYDVNNKRFSPCSLRSIRKVLQAKSGRCFSEPEESFCGNLRVEGGEECDAGLLGTEDNDMCCDKNCKLRKNQGAVCSDKNSPCCAGCVFAPPGVVCREAAHSACEGEATCNGASADCPKAPAIVDEHECAERGRCRNGTCVPYCETQGMHSCMCDIVADACKRCCRKSLNKTCFPVALNDILPDGTPCIQGFCNKVVILFLAVFLVLAVVPILAAVLVLTTLLFLAAILLLTTPLFLVVLLIFAAILVLTAILFLIAVLVLILVLVLVVVLVLATILVLTAVLVLTVVVVLAVVLILVIILVLAVVSILALVIFLVLVLVLLLVLTLVFILIVFLFLLVLILAAILGVGLTVVLVLGRAVVPF